MRQDFSQVNPEQLAQLFPVMLTQHDPLWTAYYLEEKAYLASIFGNTLLRISHIGSTAVAGLMAKPTVDILLEISPDTDLAAITETLKDAGYVVNTPKGDIIMFIKGYTPRGFEGQTFHIHIRHTGDWGELYFRDYLIAHPEVAMEYEKCKLELKAHFPYDRDGYTGAKGEFVQKYTQLARAAFPNRHIPAH